MCRPLSRRELLRYGALVAATYPAARLLGPEFRLSRAYAQGLAIPMNCELVTVSDTTAVITWLTGDPTAPDEFGRPAPVPANGRVLIGTSPDPSSWQPVAEAEPTPYHYIEITGLTPGTQYYWRAESDGIPAAPNVLPRSLEVTAPPVFTTLVPPPGRELGTVAWLNDMHWGESVSGLAISNDSLPGGGFPPGFPVDPANPYWRTMSEAAIRESRLRGAGLLLANGDITAEAEPQDVAGVKAALDVFGRLGGTDAVRVGDPARYFVTRGNHDRVHAGAEYADCSPVPGSDARDCFRDAFAASYAPGTTHFSVSYGGADARYRFVGLDSNDTEGLGVMPAAELDYLEAELDRGDATFVLCHHMISDLSTATAIPPLTFGVNEADAAATRALLSAHDNVAGVYNGHTHRNLRTTATDSGSLPFFEGGAVKEYPGGYTTVRLFEGGYLVNFWKAADPEARAWSERSRGEYLGLYPYYTLGGLGDRNWSYAIDARRRTDPAPAPRPTDPAPHEPLPATGAPPWLAPAALGAAALSSALRVTRE